MYQSHWIWLPCLSTGLVLGLQDWGLICIPNTNHSKKIMGQIVPGETPVLHYIMNKSMLWIFAIFL